MKTNKRKPTFLKGRQCLYCDEQIADGEHASRIYCEITLNIDGSVRDCKSDFHTRKNSPIKKADRATINNWKEMHRRAMKMVAIKGDTVTTADLTAYDIFLEAAMRNEIHLNFSMTSYFRGFSILTNPLNETHFITINTFKNE